MQTETHKMNKKASQFPLSKFSFKKQLRPTIVGRSGDAVALQRDSENTSTHCLFSRLPNLLMGWCGRDNQCSGGTCCSRSGCPGCLSGSNSGESNTCEVTKRKNSL